jgi:hypothetical protein
MELQPFEAMLMLELGTFYLAVLGDAYMTDALVRIYGPEVEANPRVRKMYEKGSFKEYWLSTLLLIPLYFFLGLLGLYLVYPYVPFLIAVFGLALPLLAVINVVQGGLVFYQLKRRRSPETASQTELGPTLLAYAETGR